jgi:hypothetical protein
MRKNGWGFKNAMAHHRRATNSARSIALQHHICHKPPNAMICGIYSRVEGFGPCRVSRSFPK